MKKGFTLIELLAVIVVLALLAVIVTPIILNIINNSKKGANLRSMESYAKIVQSAYMQEKIKNPSLTFEEFSLNLSSYATGYDGNLVDCENAMISDDNSVSLYNCTIDGDSNYCYVDGKAKSDCEFDLSSNINVNIGDIIYYDVNLGNICSENEYKLENSTVGYNGINPTYNQTSCLKFYVFDINETKASLILDHNTTESVTYSYAASYSTEFGPVPNSAWDSQTANSGIYSSFINKLKLDTQNWNGVLYNDEYSTDMLNYAGAKARLLTESNITSLKNNYDNYNEILGDINYATVNMRSGSPKVSVYGVRPTYSFTYEFIYGIRPAILISSAKLQ